MFRRNCIADFAGKRQTPGARGVVWEVVRGWLDTECAAGWASAHRFHRLHRFRLIRRFQRFRQCCQTHRFYRLRFQTASVCRHLRGWFDWRNRWAEAHPCILESPYHSNKPPDRHPRPPKAHNRCVAQGAAGQPIDTTGQLPNNTTECKTG